MPISEDRADKLELKLDRIIETLGKLTVLEERQIESGRRMGALEDRVAKAEVKVDNTDKKVDTWIQRGIGAWALVSTLFVLYQTVSPIWVAATKGQQNGSQQVQTRP